MKFKAGDKITFSERPLLGVFTIGKEYTLLVDAPDDTIFMVFGDDGDYWFFHPGEFGMGLAGDDYALDGWTL